MARGIRPAHGPAGILYLATTFPRLSETFLGREVACLHALLPLELISLWRGGQAAEPTATSLLPSNLNALLPSLATRLAREPGRWREVVATAGRHSPRSPLQWQELLLGLGAGVLLAQRHRPSPPAWIHAAWASAPATAAWVLHRTRGWPYSFEAHAYDLFQDGGDPLLAEKIATARWIRTSTRAARRELLARGARPEQVLLIRRGLPSLPPARSHENLQPATAPEARPLHLLSVGRLVPKKGFHRQLDIYAALAQRGTPFHATVIGDGPERARLAARAAALGLHDRVTFRGAAPNTEILAALATTDLFLFTGVIAADGNRDGLPNAVAEAMAASVPVLAHDLPGVAEAIRDGETGALLPSLEPTAWARRILALANEPRERERLGRNARQWVLDHFRTEENTRLLAAQLRTSAGLAAP
jgi:glycosyltransferase involved in cell wall biosynthesis